MTADPAQTSPGTLMVHLMVVVILGLFGLTLSLQLTEMVGVTGYVAEIAGPLSANLVPAAVIPTGGLGVVFFLFRVAKDSEL